MSDTSDLPPAKRPKLADDAQNSQDSQTYGLHVTPEEVDQLREFQVLDEVKCDEEDSNDDGSDKSESSDGVPEDELEKMLEEDLPDDFKGVPKPKAKKYIKRQKIILEEKGVNYFEVLPLDWMMVRHCSGMPIYMHRASRVCTLSKPYFLGKGNTRRHDIPISAIPCYAYRIALKEEQKQMEIDKKIAEQIKNGTWTDPNKPTENPVQNRAPEIKEEMDVLQNDDQTMDAISQKSEANVTDTPRCPFSMSLSENSPSSGIVINVTEALASTKESRKNGDSQSVLNTEKEGPNPCVTEENIEPSTPMEVNDQDSQQTESENKDNPNTQPSIADENTVSGESSHKLSTQILENANSNSSVLRKNESDQKYNTVFLTEDQNDHKTCTSILEDDNDPKPITTGLEDQNDEQSTLFVENKSQINLKIMKEVNEDDEDASKSTTLRDDENDPTSTTVLVDDNPSSTVIGEESQSHLDSLGAQPVLLPGGIVMPPPRVETVSTSWKTQQLTAEEVNAYCKKLFKFKEVYIMHFKRWADRRKYTKARKTMQYPTLPEGTKLITIPAQDTGDQNGGGKTAKRDWVMNMNGCSYLSVFHEYVRRALHKQPVYEFKQLENATAPYQATVYIGGMQYGVGRGSSKRQAKSQAARASIHILIPEMRDELPTSPGDLKLSKDDPDFTFFDYVTIEDPRIQEFCGAAAEPSPHAILRTCLLRNFGAGDRHIHTEMKKLEFQKIELTMKVGKHTATVVCKNKKQAKQRASQHILQQLHPHITSWGSLLRLYGSRSVKSCKEKKLEEQQITLLQDKARHNEPNHAVLEKLRNEMTKLKEKDNAVVPIGTLLVSEDLPTHSGSNLNNVDL